METVSENRSHGGVQGVYTHASAETGTDMTFSVFVPAHEAGARLPVLWYLSGLTCTHANVTEKGEYRAACAEHGIVFVAPDTSPRGDGVPDDEGWDFGKGAGFYVDATEAPDRLGHRGENALLAADVDHQRQRMPASGLDFGSRGVDRAGQLRVWLCRLGGDRDVGPVAGSAFGDCEPDAARGASDE